MKIGNLVVLVGCLVVAACGTDDPADNSSGTATTAAASGDCAYRGKSGFCFSPPAGATVTESGDKVVFVRGGEPKAAQDIVIRTEMFPASPEFVAGRRAFAREGAGGPDTVVVEDVDIAGGKGFYVSTRSASNVVATALVADGDKFHQCTVIVYNADADALAGEIQACKSLKSAR
ncbi:hypothetical protein [Nocardia bovistercoris]|uniref:Uncharacterized protein n=1 Tax=Nocardia bovistercoris TaxID=2785916 RepID=A0A931IAS7_9NOCA|nr:hypothetical protein [Nocardia bovistercoris]MBH0776433.1 hypothetical protein [Nocardia bovistercoris]